MQFHSLLAVVLLCSHSALAQKDKLVKKWHANTIEGVTGNGDAADRDKQINILEVSQKATDGNYTGSVEYGPKPKLVSLPCSITSNGKDIRIMAGDQQWAGQILSTGEDRMDLQLGSLIYHFKMVLVPLPSRTKPPKYPLEQFYGSWQETSRAKALNNAPIAIPSKDTIYLRLAKSASMYLPGTGNLPMYGNMDITDGDNLNIAENDFTVQSLTDGRLVLMENKETIHTLTRTSAPFAFENKAEFCKGCIVDLSLSGFKKDWFAYSIAPENQAAQPDAIASLSIIQVNDDNSFSGMVSFGAWSEKKFTMEPCKIIFTGQQMNINAKSYSWSGQVYRCSNDTLIFGKEKERILYMRMYNSLTSSVPDLSAMTIDLQPASLQHSWSAFKTEANPGYIKPEMAVIRQLDLLESAGLMKYKGKVQFDKMNKRTTQDCTVEFTNDPKNGTWVSVVTAGESWKTELFKADGKEMIMGRKSDGIRYYFRVIK